MQPQAIPARHEMKYLVSDEVAAEVSRALPPFCEPDRHSQRAPGGRYLVTSLYFDTPGRHLYWASRMEQTRRFKARVRGYATGPVFLEIKRKEHRLVLKSRATLPREDWEARLRGLPPEEASPAERDFRARMDRHQLEPASLVRYWREAWVGTYDDYARVTIDRRVEAQPQGRFTLEGDPPAWIPLDHPHVMFGVRRGVVLELKSSLAIPAWMQRLVARLDLWRQSYSKYCLSIEHAHGRKGLFPAPPTVPTYSSEV